MLLMTFDLGGKVKLQLLFNQNDVLTKITSLTRSRREQQLIYNVPGDRVLQERSLKISRWLLEKHGH